MSITNSIYYPYTPESQRHGHSQVGHTFGEGLACVKDQIAVENFPASYRSQAEEIALIIAEVNSLPAACEIQIAGNKLPAEIVRDIYSMLDYDHVFDVITRYKQARYEIKHVKTYLRTALYNSVFEFESRLDNKVRSDMA